MERRYRRGFSTAEKTELWDRWQRGESLRSIGRVFGKPSSSIYFQLAPYGGIRPAPRRRSRLALTLSEREADARFQLALVLLEAESTQEALEQLRLAVKADPDNWLIRKQMWAIEAPEAFYDGPVDYAWQKAQQKREAAALLQE